MKGHAVNRLIKVLTVGLVVLLASGVGVALWSRHGGQQITAAADQLRIPEGWPLQEQRVEKPRLLCLGDNACPSLSRRWGVQPDLRTTALRSLIVSSGWDLELKSSCEPKANGNDSYRSCSARGMVEGYNVAMYYESNEKTGTLTLFLRP